MPLVRIDLPAGTPAAELREVSGAVHDALVATVNVPPDDRFQVIGRRGSDELVCAPEYLGVPHSDRVAFVQVIMAFGRPVGLKESLFARIAGEIARRTSFSANDVIVVLVETARENWSFGQGIAQYAVQDRERRA